MKPRRTQHWQTFMSGLGALLLMTLGLESAAFSAPPASPGKECVQELFEQLEWNRSLWPILGAPPKGGPRTPVIAEKLDWSKISESTKKDLGEFALGFCALQFEKLHQTYRFRPLRVQLITELRSWRAEPRKIPFRYSLASALAQQLIGKRELVVPVIAGAGLGLLREAARDLIAPEIPLREIIDSRFEGITPLNARLEEKGAWLDFENVLQLAIPSDPERLVLRLFHELCHAWSRASGRMPGQLSSREDWIRFSLEDEFRAQVWTEKFHKSWTGLSRETGDLLLRWNRFRSTLRTHSPEQNEALSAFLSDFDALSEKDQREVLSGWIAP